MTRGTLLLRNLRFHWRAHLGVVLGVAIGTAALAGALVIGDSVRAALRERALQRLGGIRFALNSGDRLFLSDLAGRVAHEVAGARSGGETFAAALQLSANASRPDGSARINNVTLLGIDPGSWCTLSGAGSQLPIESSALSNAWRAGEMVLVNQTFAGQLGVKEGDAVVLRFGRPTTLARDAVISPREDATEALRLRIGPILPPECLGNFSLLTGQSPPANAFLPLDFLGRKAGVTNRANLLLAGAMAEAATDQSSLEKLAAGFNRAWNLADGEVSVRVILEPGQGAADEPGPAWVEVSSSRIFLEPAVVAAALAPGTGQPEQGQGMRILTYLANLLAAGDRITPYSIVTAADSPLVPADMRDDEILVNAWLADDLKLKPGDTLQLAYYVVDAAAQLVEPTNSFRVRAVVPIAGPYADRTLMPEFPGLTRAETTHDWDAGFPLVHKIRDQDEAYWKQYRGTPKAFVALKAGQQMWANRFGALTAVRYRVPAGEDPMRFRETVEGGLRAGLAPATLGFRWEPVWTQALAAADQSQDFAQLFTGFSLFLIAAAMLLLGLLFQLGVEQRAAETGTLLALGFNARQVRRLLLAEGAILAFVGACLGAALAVGYARVMLQGLTTIWSGATRLSAVPLELAASSLLCGLGAGWLLPLGVIWLAVRRQARRPAQALLTGEGGAAPEVATQRKGWRTASTLAWLAGLGAVAIVGYATAARHAGAGAFFGAGSLLLAAGLCAAGAWLQRLGGSPGTTRLTLAGLAWRGAARRHGRSLATMALLACGCFVVAAVGVFRLDAGAGAAARTSGTGGFVLVGEAMLPVLRDPDSPAGREALGLNGADMAQVRIVSLRVRDGDEASCLNLDRARQPRLLGVRPETLAGRFTFTEVERGKSRGWDVLKAAGQGTGTEHTDEIPAIGDANSIQWALGKKIGDKIDYVDEQGRVFKVRLAGAVANSILQGALLIDEAEFVKRFPRESGYRFFLIDAPPRQASEVAATLSRSLQDQGLAIVSTAARLNAFNEVQNTYLGTFQALGGLGLLLGSAGLGVVVARNLLERRGELGLLAAVGYPQRRVIFLVLWEHAGLLVLGLGLGVAAAAVAVAPALTTPGRPLPLGSLALTLAAVLMLGLFWTVLATRWSLRGSLTEALRNE